MKKFTLIEMMVVLAIIAILASFLIPALGKSRKISYRAVCASNQKQLGVGVHMHTQDNDGELPISAIKHGGKPPHLYWKEQINIYINGVPLRTSGSRDPSIHQGVFVCPATPEVTKAGKEGHGLAWNFKNLGYAPDHPKEKHRVKNLKFIAKPAEVVTIGDTSDAYNGSFQSRLLYEPSRDNGLSVSDRHLGGLNYLWLDGHVTGWSQAKAAAGKGYTDYYFKIDK